MLWKLCAIALFAVVCLVKPTVVAAHGGDLEHNFIVATSPKALPPFVFQDAVGQTVSLRDFHGRYVLLNLWASWCGPCVHEMPSLDELQNKLGSEHFMVLALNEDREGQTTAPLYYGRHDIHALAVYVDKAGRAPSVFHINGLPTSLLIDPKGNEIGRITGEADWATPEAIEFLKFRTNQ